MRSPARRSSSTPAWTCWPPTCSAGPCTTTSTPPRTRPRTSPDSSSSTTRAHDFYPDWDTAADINVAILRTSAGRDPHDKAIHDLVGELSTRSPEFVRRWASHNVRLHGTGTKRFHHHVVGELTLAYETMALNAEPDLALTIYAAEPASPTAQALTLLGTWAATQLQTADHPA